MNSLEEPKIGKRSQGKKKSLSQNTSVICEFVFF